MEFTFTPNALSKCGFNFWSKISPGCELCTAAFVSNVSCVLVVAAVKKLMWKWKMAKTLKALMSWKQVSNRVLAR